MTLPSIPFVAILARISEDTFNIDFVPICYIVYSFVYLVVVFDHGLECF